MASRECSYCYNTGHNKTTCPVLKTRIEKLRLTEPESWRVISYDRDQKRLKESRERAVRNRVCSFCDRAGHNRRGCPAFKAVKQASYEANRELRPAILEYMTRIGLAPGALMVRSESDYDYEKRRHVWATKETGEVKSPIVVSPGPVAPQTPRGWLESTPSWSNFNHRFKDKKWTLRSFKGGYQFTDALNTKTWKEFETNDV